MAETNAEVIRYQREAADYRKKHDEVLVKYQKLETDHKALTAEVATIKAEKTKAVRYQKITERRDALRLTIDVDEEYEYCKEFSDEQFDRHVARYEKFQSVPGDPLAARGLKIDGPARTDIDSNNESRKRTRYSKLAGDNVQKKRKAGEDVSYKAEFERLMDEDPEKIGNQAA